jgi:MYXO-CTERM domain-containing protein
MSRRSLRSFCWAIAFGLAMSASVAPNDASAYCQMTTGGGAQVGEQACVEIGEPLVWTNPCLSYAVDGRGSVWMDLSEIEDSVNAAFETWETAECPGGSTPNLVFKPSMQPSTCKRAEFNSVGNVNTIAFLDPWEDPCRDPDDLPYDPRAFAVTIVWHNTTTGEILDVDMMVNDQRFVPGGRAGGPYDDCPETGCDGNDADLRGIVTHEAGHFIGIGHCNPDNIDDPDDPCVVATMFASADRNAVDKRSLAPDDIDAVCYIYPPGNLNETCTAIPFGGLQLNCETTESGNPIACDAPGAFSSSSGCSCSTTQTPADALWATFAVLIGLTVTRRRSAGRGARS